MPTSEAPSKTLLLEKRDERSLVAEGKSVLEERRDILAQAIMENIKQTERRQTVLFERYRMAWVQLQLAALRHGPGGLTRFAVDESPVSSPGWRLRNYFGTQLVDPVTTRSEPQAAERWDSSVETEVARRTFHQLLEIVLEVSARTNNLVRLTREYKRTQRKVNALEHVIVPELTQSISLIEFSLEEMERENMVRALLVKRQQSPIEN